MNDRDWAILSGKKSLTFPERLQNVRFDPGRTIAPQLFEIIRRMIITFQLKPGQKISEKEIAEALQASKTPVREAFIRLEEEGLVNVVPKSGTFVAPIRIDRYFDACFIRLQLEIGAVRRAAQVPDFDFDRIERIIADQVTAEAAADYSRFFALDESMHQAIFEMAGIAGVWETANRALTELYRIRHMKRTSNIHRGPVIVDEHRAILEALRSRSPDAAEDALVKHIGSLDQEIASLSMAPGLIDYIETLNAQQHRSRQRRT